MPILLYMEDISTFQFRTFETRVVFCSPEEILDGDLFLFDKNTAELFPENSKKNAVVLPPGEQHKNWQSVDRSINGAIEASCGRDTRFLAVGGGVLCDVTAFAASVYMRGCPVSLVPTTLLAMVDASLGGKTGIDYKGVKNMVGTFYPASEVRYCPDLLKTLPEREYLSGLAEVVKTAMLGDRQMFQYLQEKRKLLWERDKDILTEIIKRCIMVKGKIVEEDLYEGGVRATLNLGHTFAHALESVQGFCGWSHGEAVAWGLFLAMETGVRLGITDATYALEVGTLLKDYHFCLYADVEPDRIIRAMDHDKKKKGGIINFILQKNIEDTIIRPVDESIIHSVLQENRNKARKI